MEIIDSDPKKNTQQVLNTQAFLMEFKTDEQVVGIMNRHILSDNELWLSIHKPPPTKIALLIKCKICYVWRQFPTHMQDNQN